MVHVFMFNFLIPLWMTSRLQTDGTSNHPAFQKMTLTVQIFCQNVIFTLLDPDAATVMDADPKHYN
jgi:hypothetical protein